LKSLTESRWEGNWEDRNGFAGNDKWGAGIMGRENRGCSFLAIAVIVAAYTPASAQDSEERAAFCMGVLVEMMDYYRHHPESLPAPSRGNRILAAYHKYERLLDAAGLLNPPTWRSVDDVKTSLRRETSGRNQTRSCHHGIQDACLTAEACLQ